MLEPTRAPFPPATLVLASLAFLCAMESGTASAATVPTGFADQSVVSSLDEPVGIAEVPDADPHGSPRVLFVEQRSARVGLIVGGSVFTVGTVPNVSSDDTERGLLGIAVDPSWPARPFLYVHYTDDRSGHHVAISRFTVTGDLGFTGAGNLQFDPSSRYDLLNDLPDEDPSHNGGTVRFGPDSMLYVSLGDDVTGCPSQDITFLGGKILRLDVGRLPAAGIGPPPSALLIAPGNPFTAQPDSSAMLVWTYGLRNPFRFAIDAATGTLYVSDVGEGTYEEMNRVPSGGMNFGWPVFEGPAQFPPCVPAPLGPALEPIYYYDHTEGSVIIAGGLYRRPGTGTVRFPAAYEGDCFLLDYVSGFLRRLRGSGSSWALATPVPGQPSSSDWGSGFEAVSDMIELSDGSLWYCRPSDFGTSLTGEVRRIVSTSLLATPDAEVSELAFEAPRPSPSSGRVTLRWSQPRRGPVRLVIYDLSGRAVRTWADASVAEAGTHERTWDGREDSGAAAEPGVYFARLWQGDATHQVRIPCSVDCAAKSVVDSGAPPPGGRAAIGLKRPT